MVKICNFKRRKQSTNLDVTDDDCKGKDNDNDNDKELAGGSYKEVTASAAVAPKQKQGNVGQSVLSIKLSKDKLNRFVNLKI